MDNHGSFTRDLNKDSCETTRPEDSGVAQKMAVIDMNMGDNPQDMFNAVQAIVVLNNKAKPTNQMMDWEICDQYEMKLPTHYQRNIEQAESKNQREQLSNHTPVIIQGQNGAPDTVAPFVYVDISI